MDGQGSRSGGGQDIGSEEQVTHALAAAVVGARCRRVQQRGQLGQGQDRDRGGEAALAAGQERGVGSVGAAISDQGKG